MNGRFWSSWYEGRVLVVRKRLVQELTASSCDTGVDSEEEDDGEPTASTLEERCNESEKNLDCLMLKPNLRSALVATQC